MDIDYVELQETKVQHNKSIGINTIFPFYINVLLPLIYVPIISSLGKDLCPGPKYIILIIFIIQALLQMFASLIYLLIYKTKITNNENIYTIEFHDTISSSIYNANILYKRSVNVSLAFVSAIIIVMRLDELPVETYVTGIHAVQISSLVSLLLIGVFPGGRDYKVGDKRNNSKEFLLKLLSDKETKKTIKNRMIEIIVEETTNKKENENRLPNYISKGDTQIEIALESPSIEKFDQTISNIHLFSAIISLLCIIFTNYYYIYKNPALIILNSVALIFACSFSYCSSKGRYYEDKADKNYTEYGKYELSNDDIIFFERYIRACYVSELLSFSLCIIVIIVTTLTNNHNIPCWKL